MNNQVKLIDGNKILNNLMEYIDTFNDDLEFAIKEGEEDWADEISNKIELLQVFVDGIMSGAYKPDTPPVPTIKPGDKVRHTKYGYGDVKKISAWVWFFDGPEYKAITPDDLEVVE
jgi:hypothetical protein